MTTPTPVVGTTGNVIRVGKRLYGVAKFRGKGAPNPLAQLAAGGTCWLDGREVPAICGPFYIDTSKGVVKIYDLHDAPGLPPNLMALILSRNTRHVTVEEVRQSGWFDSPIAQELLKSGQVEVDDGLVVRVLRGRVELFAPMFQTLAS